MKFPYSCATYILTKHKKYLQVPKTAKYDTPSATMEFLHGALKMYALWWTFGSKIIDFYF